MTTAILSTQVLEQRTFLSKVYSWMAFALGLTAMTAMFTVSNAAIREFIFGNTGIFFGLLLAELGLVMFLSFAIRKISVTAATAAFVAYSVLNGLTLSAIFLVYTNASLASTFFVTAGTFGAMSLYGYATKRDLTSIGNLCFMALIGLIIASVVNMFWSNPALYWITSYAGVLIFVGLTAYDTQKLKIMSQSIDEESEEGKKAAILGALTLYLDFINLFLMLLRIFGRRR
ncbi:MAG: Bax inhibitor-1/YccA family protein [Deltaproteobacteria bacterium]|nr:Bax inhibitor-1/YccA family protein [Deltaproteobacteria bacterium]